MIRKILHIVILLLSLSYHLQSFQINIQGDNQEINTLTKKIINRNTNRFISFFGIDTNMQVNCILAENKSEVTKYFGQNTPQWVVGLTNFRENIIILKSPKLDQISYSQFENTVKHELAHYIQNQIVPLTITPNWFDEGIAEYLSDNFGVTNQVLLSHSMRDDKLIPLKKLEKKLLSNRTKSKLAYAESASLIDFLVLAFGEKAISQILDHIRSGATFPEAWNKVTGLKYNNISFHWSQYLENRYKWIFMLDFKYLIWLIMPVLLIIGFIIKKLSNLKTVNKWEEEDAIEPIRSFKSFEFEKNYPCCNLNNNFGKSNTSAGHVTGDEPPR